MNKIPLTFDLRISTDEFAEVASGLRTITVPVNLPNLAVGNYAALYEQEDGWRLTGRVVTCEITGVINDETIIGPASVTFGEPLLNK
jgi:hypothetical protein